MDKDLILYEDIEVVIRLCDNAILVHHKISDQEQLPHAYLIGINYLRIKPRNKS